MPTISDNTSLLQIYPEQQAVNRHGLYLQESLLQTHGKPVIYANLLNSLDGRIALEDPATVSGMSTPAGIRSTLDWRFFCELQAHADVLITHSGYLRSLAGKELGNILSISGAEEAGYLREFREMKALPQQPAIIVLSSTLDFDESLLPNANIHVLTSKLAPAIRLQQLKDLGLRVTQVDTQGHVTAKDLSQYLVNGGYKAAYLQTGPEFLADVLRSRLLDRLYLTTDFSVIGGERFKTIVEGPGLPATCRMSLRSLYLAKTDNAQDGRSTQQLFAAYDIGN